MIKPAAFIIDNSNILPLQKVLQKLTGIGYGEKQIRERLGLTDLTEVLWRAIPIYCEEQLAVRDPLNMAIELFFLQGSVAINELNELFDNSEKEALINAELLKIEEGKCFARASLFPVGNHLVFSDHSWPKLPNPGLDIIPQNQVMYIGKDSRWLAHGTVRHSIDAALDLCTGSGIHAILASYHAKKVAAVDINPRAVRCTDFNTKALGITNIKTFIGDLFEPVKGQQFDLITANPPFVPSPVNSIGYRDGGNSGEDVLKRIISDLPNYLSPSGTAQIITDMGESESNPISERLRIWLNGAPMDIIIIRLREHSASSFAIGHADVDDDYGGFLNSVNDWYSNLKTQGFTKIVSILITLKWSVPEYGAPWTREEETTQIQNHAGKEIEEMFIAEKTVRHPEFYKLLLNSKLCRANPIGIMDANILGNASYTSCQAKLLGKAIPINRLLNNLEKEILLFLEKPAPFSELLNFTKSLGFEEEATIVSITNLIKSGFIISKYVEPIREVLEK